jgi:alkylhydroperoxidase family enzyme
VLEDWRTAPLGAPLRTTLALLEKVTLTPDQVGGSDVDAVRAAGVSDQAISDALHVCFMFNMIDRLADAFDWHVQTTAEFGKDAKFLLKKGYDLIGPVRKRALAAS